jgi:hypothetical protein
MSGRRRLTVEFSVEELDRELIARGAQVPWEKQFKFKDREGTPERDAIMSRVKELYDTPPPPNEELAHLGTLELAKTVVFKTRSTLHFRLGTPADGLLDWDEIFDEHIKNNTHCAAAIMLKDNLTDEKNGFSTLKVKKYGKTFNLCDAEPFYDQPAAAGHMCTGFLVKKDVIATAAHFVNERNVTDLRVAFGFKMLDSTTPVTRFPGENIYRGVEIIHKVFNGEGNGGNWALVKLDRAVVGQTIAKLSKKKIFCDQPIYVIGHPLGLPLKFGSGASVRDVHEPYFAADLGVYTGNSGSPVFNKGTNEAIGMVTYGYNQDFRWTGRCWISIGRRAGIYGESAYCTRVSEFIKYC